MKIHKSQFESPLPHYENQSVINHRAKSVPMEGITYKGLKLVQGTRWYVEYFYRIPEELRNEYGDKKWKRFRVFKSINRKSTRDKEDYGGDMFASVRNSLESLKFNPFEEKLKLLGKTPGISLSVLDAIEFFKETIGAKGVEENTVYKYKDAAKKFEEYLHAKGLHKITPDQLEEHHVISCLEWHKERNGWSNRSRNNLLGFMSIMFNYLVKTKKIPHNPALNIKKFKTVSKKHRYYNQDTLKKVIDCMKETDPHLLIAAQIVYYAGVRSAKELINLQVGDILMDRDRIRFRGAATKGNRDDYILLDPKLKNILVDAGYMNYPESHYLITYHNHPHPNMSSDVFLQKRFRKIRRKLALSEDYTLYSFKHTRAVHLLTDGAQPVDIMQLFRHTDLSTTTKYIRDLGFDLNAKFTDFSRTL